MRTYAAASAYAVHQHLYPSPEIQAGGLCQWFARNCVGASAFGTSALLAWNSIPQSHKHTGMPRAGALAYYDYPNKTGEAGHAVFAAPNGMVWSTDILRHGHVDLVPYLAPTHVWGMRYLGWIDWTPSGPLALGSLPPKPVITRPATSPWAKGPVYRSKLHYGQQNSDSVKRMQYVLKYKFGYKALTISGSYDVYTDTVVRAWQKHIGHTPDPVRKSYIGPVEFTKLFGTHSAYQLHS